MTERFPFESHVKLHVRSDKTIRTVRSVRGACEVLIDWPQARRGETYHSVREVVEAAAAGRRSADEARAAFVAFAEHEGVLVDA